MAVENILYHIWLKQGRRRFPLVRIHQAEAFLLRRRLGRLRRFNAAPQRCYARGRRVLTAEEVVVVVVVDAEAMPGIRGDNPGGPLQRASPPACFTGMRASKTTTPFFAFCPCAVKRDFRTRPRAFQGRKFSSKNSPLSLSRAMASTR